MSIRIKKRLFDRAGKHPYMAPVFLVSLLLFSLGPSFLFTQEKPQEEVTVTAVEVPVRVFFKGELVKDLVQDDFEVYENGVRQEITHFEMISRKIAAPETPLPGPAKPQPRKRLFLLIFNIFDYDDATGEAIDYFFRDIFAPGDQLIIITEGQVLNIERGTGVDQIISNLKGSLKRYKLISTAAALKNFRDVGYEGDRLLGILRGDEGERMTSVDQAMIRFFEKYQIIWEAYRNQFLIPDVGFYQGLIKRIKSLEGEKWAVCFQQRELFPKLKSASRLELEIRNWADSQLDPQEQVKARLVTTRQQELQRSFNFAGEFPADALRDLFLGSGITFHLILVKSMRTLFSQDFELKEVGQNYEEVLKEVSRSTGGHLAFSNLVAEALQQAARTEDTHYLLVYSPKDTAGQKKRALEVKVRRSGVDVVHLKNFVETGPTPVTIADFQSAAQTISFSIRHYQMMRKEGKLRGQADVKITIFDEGTNKVFDEGKSLELIKKETRISLNFGWLKPGNYFIIIQAADRIANQTDVFSGMIRL